MASGDVYSYPVGYQRSNSAEEIERWRALLAGLPNVQRVEFTPRSGRQRQGHDCTVWTQAVDSQPRAWEVERKMIYDDFNVSKGRPAKWYNNILVELWHGDTLDDGKPGWIDVLDCDFLAWGWWEFERAVVVYVPKLKEQFDRRWRERKPIPNRRPSENEKTGAQWLTWNVKVGLKELRKHVGFWDLRLGDDAAVN